MLKLLLEATADMDAATQERDTALILAARSGNFETVRLLLLARVDKNAATQDGESASKAAACNFHLEVVRLFNPLWS